MWYLRADQAVHRWGTLRRAQKPGMLSMMLVNSRSGEVLKSTRITFLFVLKQGCTVAPT